MTARRITCVFIPHLAMDRWTRLSGAGGERAVVLAAEGPHGPVVHDASPAALRYGARVGMRVVDLRAAAPEVEVVPADPRGDEALLERLALWAMRWTPAVAVDRSGPDAAGAATLVLDVTGCTHLCGGEAALLDDVRSRLAALGLRARVGLGPTWGSAWALARFAPDGAISRNLSDLDELPIAALRLEAEEARLLRRLGLDRIGALRSLPRQSLMRRFARLPAARNPLHRLDQALGRLSEPVPSGPVPPDRRAVQRLPEPVEDAAPLLPGLAADLCARLETAGEGTRHLRLSVHRTDGETRAVTLRLARPTRDPHRMASLLEPKLERLDPGPGFDVAVLEAREAERIGTAQPDLSGRVDETEALSHLIDRLSARLGAWSVLRPVLRDTHLPERVLTWVPALSGDPMQPPAAPPSAPRPLTLFDPPERLRVLYAVPEGPPVRLEWRRRRIEVARHAGPERIAPEWWHARPGTRLRDYYRIEDAEGRRYWLFREGVAGDGRGDAPEWFMHGLFA